MHPCKATAFQPRPTYECLAAQTLLGLALTETSEELEALEVSRDFTDFFNYLEQDGCSGSQCCNSTSNKKKAILNESSNKKRRMKTEKKTRTEMMMKRNCRGKSKREGKKREKFSS